MTRSACKQQNADVLLRVKAVPGASRDQVGPVVGGRLKVRVAAPPEDGRANRAIVKLLAAALGVKAARIAIESGHGHPEKVLRIADLSVDEVRRRLPSQ